MNVSGVTSAYSISAPGRSFNAAMKATSGPAAMDPNRVIAAAAGPGARPLDPTSSVDGPGRFAEVVRPDGAERRAATGLRPADAPEITAGAFRDEEAAARSSTSGEPAPLLPSRPMASTPPPVIASGSPDAVAAAGGSEPGPVVDPYAAIAGLAASSGEVAPPRTASLDLYA